MKIKYLFIALMFFLPIQKTRGYKNRVILENINTNIIKKSTEIEHATIINNTKNPLHVAYFDEKFKRKGSLVCIGDSLTIKAKICGYNAITIYDTKTNLSYQLSEIDGNHYILENFFDLLHYTPSDILDMCNRIIFNISDYPTYNSCDKRIGSIDVLYQ